MFSRYPTAIQDVDLYTSPSTFNKILFSGMIAPDSIIKNFSFAVPNVSARHWIPQDLIYWEIDYIVLVKAICNLA